MNHSTNYSVLRLLSMLGGLGLIGVAAFLIVHHAAATEGSTAQCVSPSWHWPLAPPWQCR